MQLKRRNVIFSLVCIAATCYYHIGYETDSQNAIKTPDDRLPVVRPIDNKQNVQENFCVANSTSHFFDPNSSFWETTLNDCINYKQIRRKYLYENPNTELEKGFKIAFAFLIYRDFNQFEQLFLAVYKKQNIYSIHVDKKSPEEFHLQVRRLARCFPENVFLVPNPIDVKYGTVKTIEAEISNMRNALATGVRWDYYINLTGQELPLVTNSELVWALQILNGTNLMEGPDPISPWELKSRYPKTLLYNLTKYKSSAHVIMSYPAVQYITSNNTMASELLQQFQPYSLVEESLFPVLQYNSESKFPGGTFVKEPNRGTFKPNPLYLNRFKEWNARKCHSGKRQRGICIIGENMVETMQKEAYGNKFFINKFEWKFQPAAWDCLLEWHTNRQKSEFLSREISREFTNPLRNFFSELEKRNLTY